MKLGDALRFPFRGPNAWPNLGFLLICFLIPIIGPMVAMGFQCTIERMLVFNLDADAPRFDFGKFSFYLERGVKPFVVSLLSMLVLMPVFLGLWLVGFFSILFLGQDHPAIAILVVGTAVLFWLGFVMAMNVLLTPAVFRAGVQGVIMPAFEKKFLLDYLRRVGWRVLLTNVQLILMMLPLMACACIPPVMYGVVGVLMLVQTHLRSQLYLEYLARGGMPLEIHPDEPEHAFPVMMRDVPPPPSPASPPPPSVS